MFFEVLDRAFRGCGTSLEYVRRSPEYKRLLRKEEALPDSLPKKSRNRITYRIGTLQFCALKHSYYWRKKWPSMAEEVVDRKALPSHLPDPEVRALIRCLGEALLRRAVRCLPDKAHKLAKQWKRAGTKRQREIANEFVELIPTTGTVSRVLNWEEQEIEGVLPGMYRKLGSRYAKEPNCLGKTQLVAAFFHLAGARYVSSFPLFLIGDHYRILAGKVAWRIRQAAYKKGVTCRKEYREGLSETIREAEEVRKHPAFIHGALMVQLRNKDWLLIDVNMGHIAPFRENMAKHISAIDRGLKGLDPVAPGCTFQLTVGSSKAMRDNVNPMLKDAVKEAEEFRQRFLLKRRSMKAAIEFLGRTESLAWTLYSLGQAKIGEDFCHFHRNHMRRKRRRNVYRSKSRRRKAVVALLNKIAEAKLEKVEGKSKKLSYEELCALPPKLRRKLLAPIPVMLLNGVQFFLSTYWDVLKKGQSHSQMEIGRFKYQMACAVLGHIAVVEDKWREVEPLLAEEAFSQYRLLYSALTILTDLRRKPPENVQLAADALQTMPWRMVSVHKVLATLRAHGKLAKDSPVNERSMPDG